MIRIRRFVQQNTLFSCGRFVQKIVFLSLSILLSLQATAEEEAKTPEHYNWSFEDVLGTFDRASAQRGFQVFKEVCAACHGLSLVRYRNLMSLGFSEKEVKAIAAQYDMQDGPNDMGEMFSRPGEMNDRFFQPYANEQAARAANNGAYPLDLSLIVKARPRGADYLYALLTGYQQAPSNFDLLEGQHYNPYYPGAQISMAPPLVEGQVTYADGTPATVKQMAQDVTTFLAWAAEPAMEERKNIGVKVILFLLFFTMLAYFVNKRVWRGIKNPEN